LAALGYNAQWLTFDESVQWGVVAGRKLQPLFGNWYDCISASLLGLSYFLDVAPDDPLLCLSKRKKIFRDRHQLPENPWEIPWDTPLICTWTSRAPLVNTEGAKLPKGFKMLDELHEAKLINLVSIFQDPLDNLVSYIEEGGHTVEEIEVILHCAIQEAIVLEKTCSRTQAAIARSSVKTSIPRILKHFKTGINVKAIFALHED
jgi:hypothetical protein